MLDRRHLLEQRFHLQQQPEQMTFIPDAALDFVADLLANFQKYRAGAKDEPGEQERLFNLMLVRVWAEDGWHTKLHLRSNLQVAAGLDAKRPTEVMVGPGCYQNGRDGCRSLWSV